MPRNGVQADSPLLFSVWMRVASISRLSACHWVPKGYRLVVGAFDLVLLLSLKEVFADAAALVGGIGRGAGRLGVRAKARDGKEDAVLALRFSVGFLVQVLPCVILCGVPFSNCFRGMRKSIYALVAFVLIVSDVVFTAAAVGPLSDMPVTTSGAFQNALFFIAVGVLFVVFVCAVDAGAFQKAFVVLVVMCYGYFVAQSGDFIAEVVKLDLDIDDRLYDRGKLFVISLCTAVFFVPMMRAMRAVKRLLAAPIEARTWAAIDIMLCAAFATLIAFDVVPRYIAPIEGQQDIFLIAALVCFVACFLGMAAYMVHVAAREAERREAMAQALVRREREIDERNDELARARVRVVELKEALERLGEGVLEKPAVKFDACLGDGAIAEAPVILTTGNRATSFLTSDVVYAESLNRVRMVHLAGGESFRVNMTLAQIFDKLADERFMYCHRSVVVNLDYVRLLSDETLTLKDGMQIPVSRRRMREVHEAFEERAALRAALGKAI